jgi:hypothetical protein
MSPETHQRVRKLFDEALERPEGERLAYLKSACPDDEVALQTAVRLLDAYTPAQSFLEERPRGIERIGRYMITGELGRGSMGVVYEAVDPIIGRNVAVKVIHLEALADPGQAQFLRERLFREARSAGQLFHPGIVTVLDVGQEGELAFIAMELVDGSSLQRTVASGAKLDRTQIVDILRQTAAALDFAHRNKVVHCDVKPGNIMLGHNENGGLVVKLTDFGIAKIASSTQYHTRTGLLMGTPSYMSPEQIEGHPVDGRSDQFSLAAVAFELLTGAVPFHGESLAGLAHTIVYGPRPSAREANPQLPEGVDRVLERGLAKSAGDRFPSCTEFVRDLEGSVIGVPQPPAVVAMAARKRLGKSWAIALAGLLVLTLAAAGVYRFAIHSSPSLPSVPANSTAAARAPVAEPLPLAAPVVERFTADPASIKPGAVATLRWEVKGAVKVAIQPDVGVVQPSDTLQVKPRATVVYKLEATGPGGQTATQQARVAVEDVVPTATAYAEAVAQRRAGHPAKAYPLFRQAADMGDTRAMLDLGNMSADGEGVEKNYAEALRWFRMAADRGSSEGMRDLGGIFYLGFGRNVPPDYSSAAYWFQKAADSGEADAMYDLGTMYQAGLGVDKSLDRAKQLYQDAARLGNEEARKRLADLAGH